MKDIPEVYRDKQGRPGDPRKYPLSKGVNLTTVNFTSLLEEYVTIKTTLDKLLNEMIQQQEKILIELKQLKLHAAEISEADISDKDVED